MSTNGSNAVWDLAAPTPVEDAGPNAPHGGGPAILNLAASQINQQTSNITVARSDQGFLRFDETTTFAGATYSANESVNVIGNLPIVPEGWVLVNEGIVTRTDASYTSAPNVTFNSEGSGSPGFDALNTIAVQLGGLDFFATGFGGVGNAGGIASDFNPSSGLPGNTADSMSTLGTTTSPGIALLESIPASIGDFVWHDLNADGIQDTGEPELA